MDVLVDPLIRWKRRDTNTEDLLIEEWQKVRASVNVSFEEFQLGGKQDAVNLLGTACMLLLEQERSPQWTNIDYALGCVRSKAREVRAGVPGRFRTKRKPDEIREDHRRQEAKAAQEASQLEIQKTLAKRTAISIWILQTPEEELGDLRDEAVARSRLSPTLLSHGDHTKSGVLRELMYDIAHETKTASQGDDR